MSFGCAPASIAIERLAKLRELAKRQEQEQEERARDLKRFASLPSGVVCRASTAALASPRRGWD